MCGRRVRSPLHPPESPPPAPPPVTFFTTHPKMQAQPAALRVTPREPRLCGGAGRAWLEQILHVVSFMAW